MPANVEIKARIPSVEALLPLAQALSDDKHLQRIHQDDSFFAVPHGRLKLRVFGDGSGELIHYHRPDATGPKLSDYVLVGPTRIHLDQVEGLGDFLELEVTLKDGQTEAEGTAIAHDLMARLGVQPQQLLEGAYLDLLRAQGATRG
jgi:adenylate cyclase class IV